MSSPVKLTLTSVPFILMCTDGLIGVELVRKDILTADSEAQSESGNKVPKSVSK